MRGRCRRGARGLPFGAPGDVRPPGQWTGGSARGLPIRAPGDVRTLGLPAAQLTQATLTPAPVRVGSARVGASQLVRLCTVRPRDTPIWRSWSLMVRQASSGGTTAATRTIMEHDRARVGVARGRTGHASGASATRARVGCGGSAGAGASDSEQRVSAAQGPPPTRGRTARRQYFTGTQATFRLSSLL